MKGSFLSVLKNAREGAITYYVGEDESHVEHLHDCTLICKHGFKPTLEGVELIHVNNPQLEFYKLSKRYKVDYLDTNDIYYNRKYQAYLHRKAKIGKRVDIGPGSVISNVKIEDDVSIHSNTVIYAKTIIQKGTIIESNTTIGAAGVMWVWNENKERVFLEQLGNVVIGKNCRIGTQCEIVRGSANESTIVGRNTCMAHGTLLGHGNIIGKYNHFANGVKLGGSCATSKYTFLGSGSIISAGKKIIASDVVLGAGAVVTKDITKSGVYVGCPAKRIKSTEGKLSGVPIWEQE